MSPTEAPVRERTGPAANGSGPSLPRLLRPSVDVVARIKATVHTKLLAGFLVIALLLLSLGVLCIVVLQRINQQVDTLTALSRQTDVAQQMIYEVTAQSHYRAMAIVKKDPTYTDKIYLAKDAFADNLEWIRTHSIPPRPAFFASLAAANEVFGRRSDHVTRLYNEGDYDRALHVHIRREHTKSHVLEDALNILISDSHARFLAETETFSDHRRFLTIAVGVFSGVSLLAALALGAVLSWSLIRPVRRMDDALERIAGGDFGTRIDVPNRDEFGNLTKNLNATSEQLATLYHDLEVLNTNLQKTVEVKVNELERASRLRRYLSPQLADSIVAMEGDLSVVPKRKYLIDELNDYLSEMTEIVFTHGGTLDKYVGDAVMVFFGDPVHQDDHAARAVRMAFDMRDRMTELQDRWLNRYREAFKIGIGISTGWVTVGDIGSAARSDYTVLGNEVNLASRLSDRADAGQILITEGTMAEVADLVDGKPVEDISLKGVSRPISVYEVNPRR
jgi:class 3 adenylate cyclase/HAMP domain-containing protein